MADQRELRALHLAPELLRLLGDALLLWTDAGERGRAIADVAAACEEGNNELVYEMSARIDAAVKAGLSALGLPRDRASVLEVGSYSRRWIGHVSIDGTLVIDVERVRQHLIAGGRPERIFHTWVHESIHARRPAAPSRHAEYLDWPGYEEGMVEGLARLATCSKAGMAVDDLSYEFYVQVYRMLAHVAGIDVERL